MKIDDLTDTEVLALSDEEVEMLIKHGMAEAGVPILPAPVEPEYVPVAEPDLKVHDVATFMLTDRDAADRLLAAIVNEKGKLVKLGYSSDYNSRFVISDRDVPEITTRLVYSQDAYLEHKEVLDKNSSLKSAYENAKREYDQAYREAAEVREAVTERIKEVHAAEDRRVLLVSRYDEYVVIADGNKDIAMQFLRKAFPMSDSEAALVRASQAS